jgi:hypothetical protein
MLIDLLNAIRKARIVAVYDAIDELSGPDHQELNEAIRLVRGFVNNV